MNRKLFISASAILLLAFCAVASAQGTWELDQAKNAMNKGEYHSAIREFKAIFQNTYNHESVRREAAYFIGFCQVKLNDLNAAAASYEAFLKRFDTSGNDRLIPDALYVLGHCYELLNRIDSAIRVYSECKRRFPYNDFGKKSAERLAAISSYPDNGQSVFYTSSMSKSKVMSLLEQGHRLTIHVDNTYYSGSTLADLAGRGAVIQMKASQEYYSCSTLESIARKGRLNFDVDSTYYSSSTLKTIARAGAWVYIRASQEYYSSSSLFEIAQAGHLIFLVDSSYYSQSTIDKLASYGAKIIYNDHHIHAFAVSGNETIAPEISASKSSQTGLNDPFVDLTLDSERINRINNFINAVEKREGMYEAARKLSVEDLTLDSVRKSWYIFQQLEKFNKLHTK